MTATVSLEIAQRNAKRRGRANALREASQPSGDSARSGFGLPIIKVRGGEQPHVVDEAEEALLDGSALIFVRGGRLVSPILEEVPNTDGRTTIVAQIKELCLDSLAEMLGRAATFQRYSDQKQQWFRVDPPRWVASMLLARRGQWRFPALAGVITTPTLRPDGSLLDAPGYDQATRLYLMSDPGLQMSPIPERPSRAEAEAALALLLKPLAGFPFVGAIDRAVALSSVMTTVLRPTLPVVPVHAIRAHSAGTGKSFLVDLFAAISTGRRCPVMAAGKTEEETEKRLGALLLQGRGIISIDNVNGELGGDMLCQATERESVDIRILGKSAAPEVECRAMIFATGNNLTLVGDMTRRVVLCTLDAGVERPELREFDFDPLGMILADRGAYVAAVLTIVRAYRAAGSPPQCIPLASYGPWSSTVRSALMWLGEADPVASMETAREEDPELTTIRELVGHWRENFAEGAYYTAAEVLKEATERDQSGDLVRPDFMATVIRRSGKGPQPSSIPFGRWLSSIKGRVVNGYRLEVFHDDKRGNRFALCKAQGDGE